MKKAYSVLVVLICITFIFASCSTGAPSAGSSPAAVTPPDSPAPQADQSGVNLDERPTLKMLALWFANVDLNADVVAADIEEVTGYHVEYSMLPSDQGEEKLYLELAGGADYDILKVNPNWYYKLVGQNALLPLNDLLQQYAPNVMEYTDPAYWSLTTYDDKIYGIPYVTERPNIDNVLGLRGDLLEKHGLSIPQTPEELYDVFVQLKEKEGIIPFTTNSEISVLPTIASGFGISTVRDASGVVDVDGKLMYVFKHPRFKEYLSYMQRLYREGLLDADWPLNQSATAEEKFTSGRAASISYGWYDAPRIKPALAQAVPDSAITLIEPLRDESGNRGIVMAQALNNVLCVPKSAKNAEHLMNWINMKQDPDNFMYFTLGVEGEHYTVSGNEYKPVMPVFTEKRGNAYCYMTSKDDKKYADMWLARIWRDPALGEAFTELNSKTDEFGVTNPVWDMPPLDSVVKYQQNLIKTVKDEIIKIILGESDVDSFDGVVATFDSEGGADMEREMNEWYASKK